VESTYYFGPYRSTYESKTWQFSPRVRKLGAINGMVNELVAGVDFIKWERTGGDSRLAANADANQKSKRCTCATNCASTPPTKAASRPACAAKSSTRISRSAQQHRLQRGARPEHGNCKPAICRSPT
jgi:hypothetical protein